MAWGLPCCEDAAATSVLAVFQAQKRCGALAASHLNDPVPLQRLHGSAPDIAGQNKANPLACILSFAMALRYSLDRGEDADLLEATVDRVLGAGTRTGDIMSEGSTLVSCTGMGDAVLAELNKTISG